MFKRGIVISPVYLSVENPALLSFQIFSKYHGGVWLFDNEEGSQILSELKDLKEKFSQAGMDEESGQAECNFHTVHSATNKRIQNTE